MIIRKAQLYDLPGVHILTEGFHEQDLEGWSLGHTKESADAAVEMFIKNGLGIVAIKDDEIIGCLGGFITPYWLNALSIVFQEIMWYVKPEHRKGGTGVRMLKRSMEIAKDAGATHFVMAHTGTQANKLSKLYTKLGFVPLETQYIRGIT